jgi:hypothetical protein
MAPREWVAEHAEEGGLSDGNEESSWSNCFVEELPPKALRKLGESFAGVLLEQLKAQGLPAATQAHRLCIAASPGRAHHRRGDAWRRQGGVAETDARERRPGRRWPSHARAAEEAAGPGRPTLPWCRN